MFRFRVVKIYNWEVDIPVRIKRKLSNQREFIEAGYQNKQILAKECFEGNSQLNKLVKACKQIEL